MPSLFLPPSRPLAGGSFSRRKTFPHNSEKFANVWREPPHRPCDSQDFNQLKFGEFQTPIYTPFPSRASCGGGGGGFGWMIQSQSFFAAPFSRSISPIEASSFLSSHFLLFPPSCSTQSLYLPTDGGGGGREEKGGELCQYLHCSTLGRVQCMYFARRETLLLKLRRKKGRESLLWQLEAGRGKSTHSPTKCYAERGVEAEEEDNNASERDLQGLTAFALGAREGGGEWLPAA